MTVCEYITPTVPPGNVAGLIASAAAFTVKMTVIWTDTGGFPESVTVKVTVAEGSPAASAVPERDAPRIFVLAGDAGVPEMTHDVADIRDKPFGNVPDVMAHVKGEVPPVTSVLTSNEYGCPTVAAGAFVVPLGPVGVALTVTLAEADLDVSATEVALIVTLAALAGAV